MARCRASDHRHGEVSRCRRRRRRATLDRSHLVTVQTPQAFRLPALQDAHRDEGEATDDAALVEAAGGRVVIVEGETTNRKITTPADLTVSS